MLKNPQTFTFIHLVWVILSLSVTDTRSYTLFVIICHFLLMFSPETTKKVVSLKKNVCTYNKQIHTQNLFISPLMTRSSSLLSFSSTASAWCEMPRGLSAPPEWSRTCGPSLTSFEKSLLSECPRLRAGPIHTMLMPETQIVSSLLLTHRMRLCAQTRIVSPKICISHYRSLILRLMY